MLDATSLPMQMSAGDLADRVSILTLKKERLPDDPDVNAELEACSLALSLEQFARGNGLRDHLHQINGVIWDLEAEIRKGATTLSLEEIGRRALKIRGWNAQRVAVKNEINILFGHPKERKVDHLSEVACGQT